MKLSLMPSRKTVADQLRDLIQAELNKGNTLREIARRADVAPSVLVNLAKGKSVMIETAEALGKALGKTLRLG